MPTVMRQGGFRVAINTDDHEPAHVHFVGSDGIVIINLNAIGEKPIVRKQIGLKKSEVAKALRIAAEHQAELLEHWRQVHG